jgi:hypothetical protein
MRKIILFFSILFLWTCDSGDNFLDMKGLYNNDDYTTHSFHNFTFCYVDILSSHPDGFVTLINELGSPNLFLTPTNIFGLGEARRVRHDINWNVDANAGQSYLYGNASVDCDDCTLRYKYEPKSSGFFHYPTYYFWCVEKFGEDGPNIDQSVIDENYSSVDIENRTGCDLEVVNTNTNIIAFYDSWALTDGYNTFDVPSDVGAVPPGGTPNPLDTITYEDWYNNWSHWIHNNAQLQASITDTDCNNCTLKHELRISSASGSTSERDQYFFWCFEEFGDAGPSE